MGPDMPWFAECDNCFYWLSQSMTQLKIPFEPLRQATGGGDECERQDNNEADMPN